MGEVYLSKSKYCNAVLCNKMLWMHTNKPEEAVSKEKDDVFENGTRVGEAAKGYFGEYTNIEFDKDLSNMIERTKIALENKDKIITEASFNYDNNFCSVDILKNDEDGLEIYEVKSSTEVKDIYKDDVSYQVYILKSLGYDVKKASIMYINNEYVKYGKLDLKQLFNVEDVTEIAFSKQEEIKEKIAEIREYMKQEEEPKTELKVSCLKPYECPYWEYCTSFLPEKNVFSISKLSTSKKVELCNQGIYTYEELAKQDLNPNFLQQIEVELTGEEIINKEEIREFMKKLSYPLYFLDFETFRTAIPEFDETRPYQQIPFQYSLHYIEKEGGELKHVEYLAKPGIDPRRELAERLVKDIPKDVCVTAYNMSFERMVIKNLANLYEDLSEHLMNIRENIVDLMVPFEKKWYYIKQMDGSYSIKAVLPSLFPNDPELDYHNLPVVHNGTEASGTFIDLKKYSEEEQEKIRKGLLVYCELDTYAMVKVWEKLKEI